MDHHLSTGGFRVGPVCDCCPRLSESTAPLVARAPGGGTPKPVQAVLCGIIRECRELHPPTAEAAVSFAGISFAPCLTAFLSFKSFSPWKAHNSPRNLIIDPGQ